LAVCFPRKSLKPPLLEVSCILLLFLGEYSTSHTGGFLYLAKSLGKYLTLCIGGFLYST
jgi:hypothetical protein